MGVFTHFFSQTLTRPALKFAPPMSAKAVAPAIFAVVLLTSMNAWAASRGLESPKPTALWSPNDSDYIYIYI